MTLTPPRRTARINLRVYPAFKQQLADLRTTLAADRGLHVTEGELVEALVATGLTRSPEEVETLVRQQRASAP